MNAKLLRRIRAGLLAVVVVALPACGSDGHFSLFGYTTEPLYNLEIRTVRVPIFKNDTYWRGLEFQLTEAVIREIEAKTPYKVVAGGDPADTELSGKIIRYNKNLINANQLNEVRESEFTMAVEVVWRDLRPGHLGEYLTQPLPKPPGSESVGPPLPLSEKPLPVLIQSLVDYQPELGPSVAWAQKKNVDYLAIQIISMMEKPW